MSDILLRSFPDLCEYPCYKLMRYLLFPGSQVQERHSVLLLLIHQSHPWHPSQPVTRRLGEHHLILTSAHTSVLSLFNSLIFAFHKKKFGLTCLNVLCCVLHLTCQSLRCFLLASFELDFSFLKDACLMMSLHLLGHAFFSCPFLRPFWEPFAFVLYCLAGGSSRFPMRENSLQNHRSTTEPE